MTEKLKILHDGLMKVIKAVQNYQAQYYDAKYKSIEFQKDDRVWLKSINIQTERQSRKLDWKRLDPFTIIKHISTQAYHP